MNHYYFFLIEERLGNLRWHIQYVNWSKQFVRYGNAKRMEF